MLEIIGNIFLYIGVAIHLIPVIILLYLIVGDTNE